MVSGDETLTIAATLRTTRARTRSPSTATTSAARPSLSTRSVSSLAPGNRRDCRNTIGTVEVRLFSRLFALFVEIIPVFIDLIRNLLRVRRNSSTRFDASSIRANLTRLRQAKLRALKEAADVSVGDSKEYEFVLTNALDTLDSSAGEHRTLLTDQEEAAKQKKLNPHSNAKNNGRPE